MDLVTNPEAWIAVLTLTAMELVLGIDNIVFISILVDRLHQSQQALARRLGLGMAMFLRVGLLFALSWIMGLTQPFFHILGHGVSGRDLILIGGGIFLLIKSAHEIHKLVEPEEEHHREVRVSGFGAALVQIVIIDLIFSLDSIITAVGMAERIEVMVAAVIAAVSLMMAFSGAVGRFVSSQPTVKMLALAFLVAIAVMLVADGCGHHVPKGYIYFAMAFALGVEMLNLRARRARAA